MQPSSDSAHAARRWFGKYEVLRHLANGGMAEIYLARTTGIEGFEKLMVVKRMLPALAAEPESVRLFLNEARLAAQLQHPNVVQVHDVDVEDGDYFIAMEYVHGVDARRLQARARERGMPVPLDIALSIVIDVCAGLHYAHERTDRGGKPLHIIHCDVSPSNVLVALDGRAKVADFGVAKAGGTSAETRQTALRGKFGYMSPEQCLGEKLDRRSDVYAIALLLAELTTGTRMFVGASDYEIMKQVIEEQPPRPGEIVRGYPRALEKVVLKGLARVREDRWESAQELQLQLEAFARERKLALSPVHVARYLESIFGEEIASYRAAEAAGRTIAHVTETLDVSTEDGTAVTTAEPVSGRRRTARGRRVLAAALVVAGLSLGGAAAFLASRGDEDEPVAAPARTPAPSPPPAEVIAAEEPPAAEPPAAEPPAAEPPSAPAVKPRAHRPRRSSARHAAPRHAASENAPAPWDPEAAAPPP
jgi:serine/threonine protein kinase